MPTDMKERIAQATRTLLIDRHLKKLTVKDIVEECHITRQAFYYHFAGIPQLLRWMMDEYAEQTLRAVLAQENAEDGLRCFFVMATSIIPYVEKGKSSNYGPELELLLSQYTSRFFTLAADMNHFYLNCTRGEAKIILRYHSLAVQGLLQSWTAEDTENLDQIVHTVYRLVLEGIPAQEKK